MREDRRFVAGHGRFVADVRLPGMVHVALVPSQHPPPRVLLRSMLRAALAKMPGVHAVVTGAEFAVAVDPMMNGLDDTKRPALSVGGWAGALQR